LIQIGAYPLSSQLISQKEEQEVKARLARVAEKAVDITPGDGLRCPELAETPPVGSNGPAQAHLSTAESQTTQSEAHRLDILSDTTQKGDQLEQNQALPVAGSALGQMG
jgi:hypothetical protein